MINVERLAEAFRELRVVWFNAKLRSYAHEREWEDEEVEARRKQNNADLRKEFDEQTERIIAGSEPVPIAPRCHANMEES